METEIRLCPGEDFPEFSFSELEPDQLCTVRRYVEITRHLQELHQLFLIFKFDLDAFLFKYRVTSSGKVFCNDMLADTDEDYIAINAMVISIVSAGKTLVESMRAYIKTNYEKESETYQKFEAFCSDVYDHVFAYRFLTRLRDYAQHGHLPVSAEQGWYGFDMWVIIKKPHFKHNETIRKELEAAIKEVEEKYGTPFKISLGDVLAQYTPKLLSIYRMFWNEIEKELLKAEKEFRNVIETRPENVFGQNECFPGFFAYNFVDGNLDVVPVEEATELLIQTCKKEEEKICGEYETAWKDFSEGRMVFRIIDESHLEIQALEEVMGD